MDSTQAQDKPMREGSATREERIREAAYYKSLRRGSDASVDEVADWLAAEAELDGPDPAVGDATPPSGARGASAGEERKPASPAASTPSSRPR